MVKIPAAARRPQSKPVALTVRVMTAAMGLASVVVRVRASNSSTHENIKQKNAVTPTHPTLANYSKIFTDPAWYSGYINSIIYVSINMVISLLVSLPAAYAFSRYRFLGDKHMFFWLLTNRMAPPAVFLLPFFQLY